MTHGPDPAHVWPPNIDVNRWIAWLREDLFEAVHGLVQTKEVWRGYNELLGTMPPEAREPGLFHSWVKANYVTEVAVSVRRLCDLNAQTVSLVRLLDEMIKHPDYVTRELWIDRRRGLVDDASLAERWGVWGEDVGDHLDPQVPLRDRCELLEATKDLRTYVNKHVAHIDADRGEFKISVTFDQVEGIQTLIYEIYRRYFEFLTEAALAEIQFPPWISAFKVAWDPA